MHGTVTGWMHFYFEIVLAVLRNEFFWVTVADIGNRFFRWLPNRRQPVVDLEAVVLEKV